jgi:hypothetical protein
MSRYATYGSLDDRIAQDGDVGFIGFNNRLRPDQLQAGMLADAQNIRTDRNGQAQVRKGVDLVNAPLSVGPNAMTIPFFIVDATKTTNSTAVSSSGELLLNFASAHTLEAGATAQVKLSGLSGVVPTSADGRYTATVVDTDTIKLTDKTYTNAASGNVTVEIPTLDDTAVNNIYGSTDFSDPNEASTQYIVLASNSKAVGIDIASGITFDIGYPSSLTINQSADMIQAFNKVFIFREGNTALENSLKISTISAASINDTADLVTITTSTNHNLVTGNIVTINALGFDAAHPDPNGSGISITRTSDTQFTYSLTTTDGNETYTVSTSSVVATDFTKVASGDYTQPTELDSTGFAITNGLATVTVSNTLSVGDNVVLTSAGSSTLTEGDSFVVAEVSSSEFKFFVNTDDVGSVSDVHFTKKVSVGLGFIHMPAPPFATYHQRRLVMPFKFLSTGTDTFETRNIQDEIIASDVLDTNTYDQVFAQYRFNAGTSDFVVGLHSFAEDRLLVFNRNSIHIVTNTTNLLTSSAQVLTDEVGCVARKSIEQVGNQVIFLSDNGVYGTQFLDEYNLRGTETPLSEPINTTISRINKNAQANSVAVYFDNRYYIAVPLDSSTSNNAILIYNFLNKQWESIDQVNNDNYQVSNLLVLGEGDKRGVYAVNDIGGVHRIDHRVDGVDRVITQIGGTEQSIQISGELTTRQYTLGTLDRKRWKQFDLHIQSSDTNTSDLNINFETENPDNTGNIGTLSGFNNGVLAISEDVSIRGRIGNRRGYGIQFTFNNMIGRPIIRAIEVEGATTMRSITKAI